MSLINDVLKNIDARQAGELSRLKLNADVHPVPEIKRKPKKLLIGGIAAAVLAMLGGAGFWWWQTQGNMLGETTPTPPAIAAATLPPATPVPAAIPATEQTGISTVNTSNAPVPPNTPPSLPNPPNPPSTTAATSAVATNSIPNQTKPANQDNKSAGEKVEKAEKAEKAAKPMAASKTEKAEKPKPPEEKSSATPEVNGSALPPLSTGNSVEREKSATKTAGKSTAAPTANAVSPHAHSSNAGAGSISITPSVQDANSLYKQGQSQINARRFEEGIAQLRQALQQDPKHVAARQLLFQTLLNDLARSNDALKILQEGLEFYPQNANWASSVARLQVDKNDWHGAQEVLAKAYGSGNNNPAYVGFYAHVQRHLGKSQEAVALFTQATRLAPNEGRWWVGLADALEASGRNAEAKQAYRSALETGNLSADLTALAERKAR